MESRLLKPKVWIETGVVLIYGANIDANYHKHVTLQIIWPKRGSDCVFNDKSNTGLTIIDSQTEHRLHMSEGWIVLVEPSSALAYELRKHLNGDSIAHVGGVYNGHSEMPIEPQKAYSLLHPMCDILNIDPQYLCSNLHAISDKRIDQLLHSLDLAFNTPYISPDNWKAENVAARLHLSQSRFLHLFTDTVGIAWRPFLLWKRMLCALHHIANDVTATEAAHIAGFSDSAHLSRTFKATFGMTIYQAKKLLSAQPK